MYLIMDKYDSYFHAEKFSKNRTVSISGPSTIPPSPKKLEQVRKFSISMNVDVEFLDADLYLQYHRYYIQFDTIRYGLYYVPEGQLQKSQDGSTAETFWLDASKTLKENGIKEGVCTLA